MTVWAMQVREDQDMATSAPSKWAVGGPMIEWCERHGLDANRIPEDRLTITQHSPIYEPDLYTISAWETYSHDEILPAHSRREGSEEGWLVERVHLTADLPPLNPEWVALFGRRTPSVSSWPGTLAGGHSTESGEFHAPV